MNAIDSTFKLANERYQPSQAVEDELSQTALLVRHKEEEQPPAEQIIKEV